MKELTRSCWNCNRQDTCWGYKSFVIVFSDFGWINISSADCPGGTRQIYEAIGNACRKWQLEK